MAMTLPDKAKKMFQGKNFAHIASLMPDGSPQVSAVWVEVDGNNIVLNTDESTLKVKNFRKDPRTAISIVDQEDPYQAVVVRGRVVEIRPDTDGAHIDSLAKKYLGLDEYPFHQPDEKRVIVVVEPDKVGFEG